MTLFGPRITIYMKNGKVYSKQGTGREFIWDFDEEARQKAGVARREQGVELYVVTCH